MTARYMIKLTDEAAWTLEGWLGGRLQIVPAADPLGTPGAVSIAGLDAITDEEYEVIGKRLRSSGPLYHAGGPS